MIHVIRSGKRVCMKTNYTFSSLKKLDDLCIIDDLDGCCVAKNNQWAGHSNVHTDWFYL